MNKNEAIDMVEKGNEEWCLAVEALFISNLPESGTDITSDNLWETALEESLYPREPRAMGAVMRSLYRQGYIKPLQKWIPSSRPACHSRPLRVWRVKYETI